MMISKLHARILNGCAYALVGVKKKQLGAKNVKQSQILLFLFVAE